MLVYAIILVTSRVSLSFVCVPILSSPKPCENKKTTVVNDTGFICTVFKCYLIISYFMSVTILCRCINTIQEILDIMFAHEDLKLWEQIPEDEESFAVSIVKIQWNA